MFSSEPNAFSALFTIHFHINISLSVNHVFRKGIFKRYFIMPILAVPQFTYGILCIIPFVNEKLNVNAKDQFISINRACRCRTEQKYIACSAFECVMSLFLDSVSQMNLHLRKNHKMLVFILFPFLYIFRGFRQSFIAPNFENN